MQHNGLYGMSNVVNMTDYKAMEIKPKSEARKYKGHSYTLIFNPRADVTFKWQWHLRFTRVYEFAGSAPTIEGADKAVRAKIAAMEGRANNATG